ncbi:holin family protein [Phaeobacter sp. QD34_3]|uniref:holin family protein n=2 Tax=unclassified Phaeobacter TaxID=2621772 RepID=UPI00237F1DE4|nr:MULTISPECIES: holin family protein [unclassified Phaeobacter]MDE4131647.1 holin family protein [Phaeobacter sp. QD34_3]MDE4135264.1 holin family protein [Phaeobacter sp. QD34_24]
MIMALLKSLFGNDRNLLRETVEVFRENAEGGAQRAHLDRSAALQQFAAEFDRAERSGFDRVMDGLNRLPRPLMAFATLALLASAMIEPIWFAQRMRGLALVPEPLWWLLGVIVSFYFGARHQAKSQDFQRSLARAFNRLPVGVQLQETGAQKTGTQQKGAQEAETRLAEAENAALRAWRRSEKESASQSLNG